MEITLNLFVILLFLSAFYFVLGLACALIERVATLGAARVRRARTQTGRTQRRVRTVRPRRRRDAAEDLAGGGCRPVLEAAP